MLHLLFRVCLLAAAEHFFVAQQYCVSVRVCGAEAGRCEVRLALLLGVDVGITPPFSTANLRNRNEPATALSAIE